MTKKVRDMPRLQQKAAMARIYRQRHPEYRETGRTAHEMIEDSLLYGVERFTARSDERLQQMDRDLGIDPEIGRKRRNLARCETETLMQLDKRGVVADHSDYLTGMRGLLEKGDARRKASGKGFMITPQGRRRIKEIDAAVVRHFEKVPKR